jgi:hypothetical protein
MPNNRGLMLFCEERRKLFPLFFLEMAFPQMRKQAAPPPNAKNIPKRLMSPVYQRIF